MAIAIASISASVYKYFIHRIAISYGAGHAIFAQIVEKHHRLLCRSTLYLYCIYIVLLYLQSTCVKMMRVLFTILFHLKTMTAPTFNTFQVYECLISSPPSFVHNMAAPNFNSFDARIYPVCMLRLSTNSYLNDTAHKLSWSKLSDFSIKTFLKKLTHNINLTFFTEQIALIFFL